MKKISPIEKAAAAALLVGIYFFGKRKRCKIPFDRDKACENIRPFNVLMEYVERFEKRHRESSGNISFEKTSVPTSITFNRDAIIALINAPKAEKVRVYFGIKKEEYSGEEKVVFCIFPVNKKNKVIEAELVKECPPIPTQIINPNTSNESKVTLAFAVANDFNNAQGVDDGQRPPYDT